ncbi:MAG: hypothetical protein K2G96_04525, partial [Clostridia bacterium]|nr:hypothetical protein [Clostridia bacterium]
MDNTSKPISKTDDASKQMQMDALKGDYGHGIDIDTIYYVEGAWCVFEYLKCDNNDNTPYSSDPAKYPKNWRKFHSLFQIAKQLNGKLILVNYSTRDKDKNEVKVMFVKNINYDLIRNYIKSKGAIKYLKYIEYEQVYE